VIIGFIISCAKKDDTTTTTTTTTTTASSTTCTSGCSAIVTGATAAGSITVGSELFRGLM
jgi:hypothetical protein